MAKLTNLNVLREEDFDEENQQFISKIAYAVNPFIEQVTKAFNKRLSISENLNQEIRQIKLSVDANGKPTEDLSITNESRTRISGFVVLRARNLDTDNFPTSAPFISFRESEDRVVIQHVAGLQANEQYSLTVLVVRD